MKNLLTKSLLYLPVLFISGMLGSCAFDHESATPDNGNDQSSVTFSVKVPSAANPATRALAVADESAVTSVDVFVFDSDGDLYDYGQGEQIRDASTPDEVIKTFKVKLRRGTGLDVMLLANAREAVEAAYPGGVSLSVTKASLTTALTMTLPATGWNATPSDTDYKPIPMWGTKEGLTINENTSLTGTGSIRITRMVARVNVSLNDAIGESDFKLTSVHLYNYNGTGRMIPDAANGNWTATKPYATAPTVPTQTLIEGPISYTTMTTSNKALARTIYMFEGARGVAPTSGNFMKNPCLVVGGKYNGASEETFYRIDFTSKDPDTGVVSYLDILRNHSYNVVIKSVNGPGKIDEDSAFNSIPENIETNIVDWNDGEYHVGIWNGTYEIKFTGLDAHFTQFGEPTPQTIKIRTNVPELTFDSFSNDSKGAADGDWTEAPAGTWSNGHFNVVISKGAPDGDYTEYTLTVTAAPTTSGDPARETRFRVSGSNLDATLKITQDEHITYRLITTPDPMNAIMLDGAAQYVKVDVTTTHPYNVELKDNTMFNGVYTSATGATVLAQPSSATEFYVKVGAHASQTPRVGEFVISHADTNSDAAARTYNVLQVTPVITAVLSTGGVTAEVQKTGGSVTIKVGSNMSLWNPVLKIKVGSAAETTVAAGNLSTYFDIVNGNMNANVKFTAPKLADAATDDVKYTITFKDANGSTTTTPAIVITQKAKVVGAGGGGTKPTGSVLAPPGIIGVGKTTGKLTIDGSQGFCGGTAGETVYVVYFRWGSVIALSGNTATDEFNNTDVAWTPEEYDYSALMKSMGTATGMTPWGKIPYSSGTSIVTNYAAGTGDPCKLAAKDGVTGGYKMPAGNPYKQFTDGGWATVSGVVGRWSNYGSTKSQFYPAAGCRFFSNGQMNDVGTKGYYRSSTCGTTNPYYMYFTSSSVYLSSSANSYSKAGYAVRCIPN